MKIQQWYSMVIASADTADTQFAREKLETVLREVQADNAAAFKQQLQEEMDEKLQRFDDSLSEISRTFTRQLERELSSVVTKAFGGGADARVAGDILGKLSTDFLTSAFQGGSSGNLFSSAYSSSPSSFTASSGQQSGSLLSALTRARKNL